MRQDIDLTSFTGGEVSPRLKGRIDYAKFFVALDTCLNMVVLPQGGVTRRPGTVLVALAKDQANPPFSCRLFPFIFSTLQPYILEFSNENARVYANDAVVVSGSTPVDVALPYTITQLPAVKFTQSDDELFLCHPLVPTGSLNRFSSESWSYAALYLRDGPYLSLNPYGTTLTASGTNGTVTIAASSTNGINTTPQSAGLGFLATDVGRTIRFTGSSAPGWLVIDSIISSTQITATVQPAIPNGADGTLDTVGPTTNWLLGKWSSTTGFPYCPTFWQQRFMLMGTNNQPNALEGSVIGDFTNFAPTDDTNTPNPINAISWVIDDDQVNSVNWTTTAGSAQTAQLAIGTRSGEQILQPATTTQAIGPNNVQAYRETQYGSAPNVNPLRIGKAVLFTDRPGRRLYEWIFQWTVNGYLGFDRSVDAEHITLGPTPETSGIVRMAYQQAPYRIVWCLRADGQLIGMTYLPEQNIWSWHRHQLGGNYYGGPPVIEDIAVIPSPDQTYDELWLLVCRTVNGVFTRTVEVLSRFFDGIPQEQAIFMDCSLVSALVFPAAELTLSAASGTATLFTANAAAFVSATAVGSYLRVNGGVAVIRSFLDTEHVTGDWLTPAISTAPAIPNGWSCTPQQNSFGGLSLTGEIVQILGDGADFGTQTVEAGSVTLPSNTGASLAAIGLPAPWQIVTMPFEPQRAAAASSQGKVKRIDHLYLRLLQTLDVDYGIRKTDPMTGAVTEIAYPIQFRSAGMPVGQPPALFTGMLRLPGAGGYDFDQQQIFSGSGPFPVTLLAVSARAQTGEMPLAA